MKDWTPNDDPEAAMVTCANYPLKLKLVSEVIALKYQCVSHYEAWVHFWVRVWVMVRYDSTIILKKSRYGYGGIFFYYIYIFYILMHTFLNIYEF